MKRRNQLISALMAGVMISGSVSAASGLTLHAAAAEDDFGSDDSFDTYDAGDYNDEYSDGGDSFDSGESGGTDELPEDTYESVPDSDPVESYTDEGGEGLPDSGDTSFPESVPAGDPSSDPDSTVEMTESEARALDEAEASFNEQSEAEELARLEALEQEESEAAMLTQVEQSEAESAEDELDRAAEEAILEQVRDELKAQADEEAALKKAQEEQEKAANTVTSYGYAASNRAYYSGSYFVTSAQKRLALNVGFKKIDKVPAMSAGADAVYIRETQASDGNVVGVLDSKSICYIIDDTLADWVFVESGEVRGFALKKALRRGKDVETYVNVIGETNMTFAQQKMDPLDNTAYRFSLNTTKDVASILQALGTAAVDRQAMIQFSMQFLGNPYVWGGESLTMGCDCSGFTQQIYAQFGVSIPRTSYQQAEVGVKIPTEEAVPGDLIFYARDGVVYHVLMYIGDNKAINASSSTTGIIISDVDYTKACWACRYISDTGAATALGTQQNTSTQASALQAIGQMAYNGDAAAQEEIITALAQASLKEWRTYGFCRSVIIAQAINESGWLSFGTSAAGIQSTDNNILGMNEELLNSQWTSPWDGRAATRLVPQYVNGGNVLGFESMRLYEDMEACMEDYAAFKVGLHPNLIGLTDVDTVIAVGLKGYATNPNYESTIKNIIDKYGLTRFDTEETAAAAVMPAEPIEGLVVATETSEFSDDTAAPVIVPESAAPEEAAYTPEVTDDGIEIVYFTDDSADFAADGSGYESETAPAFEAAPAEESEVVLEADESAEEADFIETVYFEDFTEGENGVEVTEPIPVPASETGSAPAAEPAASPADRPSEAVAPVTVTAGTDTSVGADTVVGTDTAVSADTSVAADTDTEAEVTTDGTARSTGAEYTAQQMEVIYAAVAEADDTSYDGALAVISSVMNRADVNYGGFGIDAYSQITADGQYAYSPKVEDPLLYERRLGGNVPDFVKQAIKDCLENNVRNNEYTSFRRAKTRDDSVQIGANWYYTEAAVDANEALANMADAFGIAADWSAGVNFGTMTEISQTTGHEEALDPGTSGSDTFVDDGFGYTVDYGEAIDDAGFAAEEIVYFDAADAVDW